MQNDNTSKMKIISYISNIISFISAIITILSFYGYYNYRNLTLIIISVFLVIATIFIFKYRYKISKYILVIILNKTVPRENIKILNKEVVYTYVERYKFKLKSSFSIKVIGDEPINSHDEYLKWTAGFVSNIQPLKRNQRIEYDKNPLSYNDIEKQKFSIIFPNSITKNDDPYKTGFNVPDLNDDKHIAKPILQSGIYHITNELILKVYFQENLNPLNPRGLKYAHFIDKIPYNTEELERKYDDEKNMHYVEFRIKNPIYGGKYAIDWSFNDWFYYNNMV